LEAKFAYGGFDFKVEPIFATAQQPQKIKLASKVAQIDSKIIIVLITSIITLNTKFNVTTSFFNSFESNEHFQQTRVPHWHPIFP
jgi:hypothetical protein